MIKKESNKKPVDPHKQEFKEFKRSMESRTCLSVGSLSNIGGSYGNYPRSVVIRGGRMISVVSGAGDPINSSMNIMSDGDFFSMKSPSVARRPARRSPKRRPRSTSKSKKKGDSPSQNKKSKKKKNENDGPDDDQQIQDNINICWTKYDNIGSNFLQFIDCLHFSRELFQNMG